MVAIIHRLFDYLLCQMERSDCGSTNAESCRCAGKTSNPLMEFWMWNAGRQELEGLKVEGN